jgi:hypothetical protein
MSGFELAYICFTIGAFVFFGVALSGAVAYSNAKPKEQDSSASHERARA